nr:hypothetical protein XACLG97_2250005 [Xanthomonas citri pv. citri]
MPPSSATAAYHHGDLPAALRRAGWDLLGESGLRGLTLRACARRAGVSHAAPAHHFGSLDGLLADVAADGYERMLARILATQREVDDPLMGCGLGYIRFALEFPQHFRLMLGLDVRALRWPRLTEASARRCVRNGLPGTLATRAPRCSSSAPCSLGAPYMVTPLLPSTGSMRRCWALPPSWCLRRC